MKQFDNYALQKSADHEYVSTVTDSGRRNVHMKEALWKAARKSIVKRFKPVVVRGWFGLKRVAFADWSYTEQLSPIPKESNAAAGIHKSFV